MRTRLVEETEAENGQWKTQIWERSDATFEVLLFRWIVEPAKRLGSAGLLWAPVGTAVTIGESVERARELARELAAAYSAQYR